MANSNLIDNNTVLTFNTIQQIQFLSKKKWRIITKGLFKMQIKTAKQLTIYLEV